MVHRLRLMTQKRKKDKFNLEALKEQVANRIQCLAIHKLIYYQAHSLRCFHLKLRLTYHPRTNQQVLHSKSKD